MIKYFQLTFLLFTLQGCALFEALADGLADLVAQYQEGPIFAYTLANGDQDKIYVAAITDEDRGILLQAGSLNINSAYLSGISISADRRFVGGSYEEQVGLGETDFGVFVMNARSGDIESFRSDNTIVMQVVTFCSANLFDADIQTQAEEYVAIVFADLQISPEQVVSSFDIQDTPSNTFVFNGWAGPEQFVGAFDLEVRIFIEIPSEGISTAIEETIFLGGQLLFERSAAGDWAITNCAHGIATIPSPPKVHDLTLSDGELLLDGVELVTILDAGPFELHRVRALSGPY